MGTQMFDNTLSLSLRLLFMTFSICGTHIDNLILIQHSNTKPRWRSYNAIFSSSAAAETLQVG
jgi:hypothetical protein